MMLADVNWTTVSALATGFGTLVLAIATFASVRSANRAARTAEHALHIGQRPVLFPSRFDDSVQKIRWGDEHWARLGGGRAAIEEVDGIIYMALSLRNVGSGIAVIHSWRASERQALGAGPLVRPPVEDFRPQTRDLYVPAGDVSFWQAAVRDPDDPYRPSSHTAVAGRQSLTVDLLYSDHEGEQRTISRFLVTPVGDETTEWLCSVVRHWNLDRPDPRD
jgi:hypothetical protein